METVIPDSRKYPIGRFIRPADYDAAAIAEAIGTLEGLPDKLLATVAPLKAADWLRTYRPDGWTIRQVLSHLVDANVNNYTRFKFALTEENPAIKPYLEEEWSDLPDAREGDVGPTLDLLAAIHAKWIQCLRSLGETEYRRTFFHPRMDRAVPLFEALGMYAWHSEHHLAHIRLALQTQAP